MELRERLEKALGRRFDGDQWETLLKAGYIDPELSPDEQFDYAIEWIRRLGIQPRGASLSSARMVSAGESAHEISWSEAVSRYLAANARRHDAVLAYRAEYLPDGLIPETQFETWLCAGLIDPAPGQPAAVITYPDLSDPNATPYPVRSLRFGDSAPLNKLKMVAEQLYGQFSFLEFQSVAFILADLTPILSPVSGHLNVKGPHPVRSRFVLEVDPAIPPREVEERYRTLRKQLLDRATPRRLSDKHLRLAVFVEEILAAKETVTWPVLRKRWNETFPQYMYASDQEKNFARDARAARKRLQSPTYL